MESHDSNQNVAKVNKIKRWSSVWIIPIVTALIGIWIVAFHFFTQGPEVTLYTTNAEGIEAGKTAIKSRSVDIGKVERVTLDTEGEQVIIQARLNSGMAKLLTEDTIFWVVKPQIGREGVSGLGTLLSGVYIELQPGSKEKERDTFSLLDSPPLAPPDAKGLRVVLNSEQSGQLTVGDPVLFRGFRVGTIESGEFDPVKRLMRYQLFISSPYERLVTTNVRFWKESGVAFDMSSQGLRLEFGSLATLFTGGVSFDVPSGSDLGEIVTNYTEYMLYPDNTSTQDSLYTRHEDVLMFFGESIRGLQTGAPVEFRGIRLGTVAEVPFFLPNMGEWKSKGYRVPVLVRIEPDRLKSKLGDGLSIQSLLQSSEQDGLRAALKSGNLLTGALYIDLDFYQDSPKWTGPSKVNDYPVMPTVNGGLTQVQQKVMQVLDKVNGLPIEPVLNEMTKTLSESKETLKEMRKLMSSLDKLTASNDVQGLPKDLRQSLTELNRTLKGFQPGTPAYSKLVADMQRLEQVLKELQPVLKTLNDKSNALVFEAKQTPDPQPKKAAK